MTDHKPFTAEQLDRIETASKFLAQSPEEHEVMLRLIAQAREANRLQGVIEEVAAFLRNGPPAATVERKEVLRLLCNEQLASFDPAARAKRELGEFLVSNSGWTQWREDRGEEYEDERWVCQLTHATGHGHKKFRPTEHEAITAALRAAKGSGR